MITCHLTMTSDIFASFNRRAHAYRCNDKERQRIAGIKIFENRILKNFRIHIKNVIILKIFKMGI